MTRPAFNPDDFESAELAEINRPLHDPSWDLIEAQAAYRAEPSKANHELVMERREIYQSMLAEYDAKVAAYIEAPRPIQPDPGEETIPFDFA